ncbi:MAG: helix-turn-helix transcriptional regulator [Oscillospiraceae bacterium]|nr:helix-turn-helix transcriptional regulator [Oscillospiraceae bacterium]
MRDITIAKNISELRKTKGVTQEQLANALNVSFQAVSKWENGISIPDTMLLPKIAEYFNVSIDYLLCGENVIYDNIYETVMDKVMENKPQMSNESYEEALRMFAAAHHGISRGNLKHDCSLMRDEPAHIFDKNGVSILSGKGFGAVVTRDFFSGITKSDVERFGNFFGHLTSNNIIVLSAIVSMSDISYDELMEKTGFDEKTLRETLDDLIKFSLVNEKESKHKTLRFAYEIPLRFHTTICLLLAVMKIQLLTDKGISCCMGYGDFPISFD